MHDGTTHYDDREKKGTIICQTANRISQDKFLNKAISSEYLVDRISRTTEIALKSESRNFAIFCYTEGQGKFHSYTLKIDLIIVTLKGVFYY